MTIPESDWIRYITGLSKINATAAQKMQAWFDLYGTSNIDAVFNYAFGLSSRYGEAAAALACEMYDALASAQGAALPAAQAAETATIGTVRHLVGKALQKSAELAASEVGKMVKQAGADTMIQNAARDGAEWAWIPHGGESCAFCLTLASKGWQKADKSMRYQHAEHIHANCNCEFAVRFDRKSTVGGYNLQRYKDLYNGDAIDDDILETMGYDPDLFRHGYVRPEERTRAIRRQIEKNTRAEEAGNNK